MKICARAGIAIESHQYQPSGGAGYLLMKLMAGASQRVIC
jgi:hypothetical protein